MYYHLHLRELKSTSVVTENVNDLVNEITNKQKRMERFVNKAIIIIIIKNMYLD